jgi:hypothetical protein
MTFCPDCKYFLLCNLEKIIFYKIHPDESCDDFKEGKQNDGRKENT